MLVLVADSGILTVPGRPNPPPNCEPNEDGVNDENEVGGCGEGPCAGTPMAIPPLCGGGIEVNEEEGAVA